jgi:thiamine-monophosphate kinase
MAEKDWIKRYFAPLAKAHGAVGLSDDVAELRTGGRRIVTVDALVEGVHFLSSDPIETVARKLVRVNVSDVLASGAIPEEALLTLAWPQARTESELAAFASALGEELTEWSIDLMGGDTVRVPEGGPLMLSLTLTGRCLGDGPVRRAGAKAGNDIWVSGEIGAGALGLQAALAGDSENAALAHYRVPKIPKKAIAELIARYGTASVDVSDGLLGDLSAVLAASGVGAELLLECVPFPIDIDDLEGMLRCVTGGDDYQSVFCAAVDDREKVADFATEKGIKISRIGQIQTERGLRVNAYGVSVNLPETLGFEHR